MKKLIILLTMCATLNNLTGQNSFGIITYPHNNAWLSSGTVIQNTTAPGFLMAGFEPSLSNYNFIVDRTNAGGQVGGGAAFQRGYSLNAGIPLCTSTLAPMINCYGATAIVCSGTTAANAYAVVAGVDIGCLFVMLSNTGTVTAQLLYRFPGTPTLVTKPIITESAINPGTFYITGSYDGKLYVMDVNSAGVINKQHTSSSTAFLDPRAIIESPYGSNDITIVGVSLTNTTSIQDGFFYQIPNSIPNTGPTQLDSYDITVGGNTNNGFTSIVAASSTTGYPAGFMVGGFSDASASPGFRGQAWMLKIDPTGGVSWSTLISGQTDAQAGKVHAVIERLSTSYTMTEYYGAASCNSGITVYKLDENGVPYTFSMGQPDEFVFNTGSNSHTFPTAMSFNNLNSTGINEGLHIYGNLEATGPGDFYLVESYFNGYDGCNGPVDIAGYDQNTTPTITAINSTTTTALTSCTAVTVNSQTMTSAQSVCGTFTSVASGSNARTVGMDSFSGEDSPFIIMPNPSTGRSTLKYTLLNNSLVSLDIIDNLGQVVNTSIIEQKQDVGEHKVAIDLEEMQLPEGVYFLQLDVNGKVSVGKLIYAKN